MEKNSPKKTSRVKTFGIALVFIVILGAVIIFVSNLSNPLLSAEPITTMPVTSVPSTVQVSGMVVSKNQTTLHFQEGGEIVYLPFQEGDSVKSGQVIASINAVNAEQDISVAQASYRSAQSALNKVLDDIHLFQYGNGGFANVGSANETQTQTTERQEAQEAVNIAYDNLQKADQELVNTSITAPFNGVLTEEDITNTEVNVTPTNSFVIADPSQPIFEAEVDDTDINYINEGDSVAIQFGGANSPTINGTVSKIYPSKITFPDGQSAFRVDIDSPNFQKSGKLGLTGQAMIQISRGVGQVMVPSWLVLGHQYVWVLNNNRPKLETVSVGDERNGQVQILNGLSKNDQLITNPQSIISKKYQIF